VTISFRQLTPNDPAEGFVYSSWIKSYLSAATGGDSELEPVELAHFLVRAAVPQASQGVRAWIDCLRLEHDCKIWVVYPEDDPSLFLGFVAAHGTCLDYLYVKKRVRRQGVATMLIHHVADLVSCSSLTWPWVAEWLSSEGLEYQPRVGSVLQHVSGDPSIGWELDAS
jgi:GNAT superfamily N-acetyltransferase